MEEYVRISLQIFHELNIPILRYLNDIGEEKLIQLSIEQTSAMMKSLADNDVTEFINITTRNWVENLLPVVQHDQVVAEDIILVNFTRRKVMRELLKTYTTDIVEIVTIIEEIDTFLMEVEIKLFKNYFYLQQERINSINSALEKREKELLEAQEVGQIGSFEWDLIGKNSSFTPQLFKILEMEGTSNMNAFLNDVHPEDRDMVKVSLESSFVNGHFDTEYRYLKNKHEKVIWAKGKVSFDNGTPVKMIGTIMDVSERHRIIKQIKQNEDLHKQAQALSHIGNWSWEIKEEKITWSDEMYRIYGLEPQSEVINFERFISFIVPEDRDKRIADIRESLRTFKVGDYQFRIQTSEGITKVLNGKGSVEPDEHGKPFLMTGTCQDVTKEFLLNKELLERENYLNQLLENAPDSVIVINDKSEIIMWNPKSEHIFGWKKEEVIGKNLSDFIIPERYRQSHFHGMQRLVSTGEARVLNKTIEINALNKDGIEFFISLTISQSKQADKNVFISFIRDITLEKKTQDELNTKTLELADLNHSLENKNLQLIRTNKELESFNYIASHDLQEPLRKIQFYSDRLRAFHSDGPGRSFVEKINGASQIMQKLIRDFLSFSNTVEIPQVFEKINVQSVIEEIKTDLMVVLDEKKATILANDLPDLNAIPFQLKQLFTNIIGNSLKYSRPGVPPVITITSQKVSGSELLTDKINSKKVFIRVSVKDNGIGFDQMYAEKIFHLFQRLHQKEDYSGTGIGLAICKKIVENHHGFITAHGAIDQGALFKIYFPDK